MSCVHPRLVEHDVVKVGLDLLSDLDLVALDFPLEPQAQTRMMDS